MRAEERFAEVPVVLLTASHQEAAIQRDAGLAANDYLVKPYHYVDFMDAIRIMALLWVGRKSYVTPKQNV